MRWAALAWTFATSGLLAMPAFAADTVYYYSSDTLHSEVVVTDQNHNVVERTHYAPYGQVLDRDLRDGPGYTGHEEDPETNLVYMQQRYYDPEAGRFLSTDPVQADGGGGSFNRYEYANDNPYRYVDPFGEADTQAGGNITCTGSHIGGAACGSMGPLKSALATAKQVAIGFAKATINTWNKVAPGTQQGPLPNGVVPYDERAPLTPSNGAQVGGMIAGGIVIGAAISAATDDPALVETADTTSPNFVVTPKGEAIRIPSGATGPTSTRAPGIQYVGGSGGNGLDSRVTGVRIMEGNTSQGPRAVYMNKMGQTVNPSTGKTVPNADPTAHWYLEPWQ